MRTSLLLGLVSLLAAGSAVVACAPAETGDESSLAQRKANASGDDDDSTTTTKGGTHDSDPTIGEHDVDTGNPNATTSPTAPTQTGTASSQFALALAMNTPSVNLGDEVDVPVTVTSSNGFTGPVQLSVTGLPAGATADPVTATVSGSTASATIKIKAAVTAAVTATGASLPLTITGTGGGVSATATASFKVAPKVVLTIPMNIDALRAAGTKYVDDWGTAFGSNPTSLLTQADNPIVVNVFNADSKAHIVHGANGFAHGDTANPIPGNSTEMQNGVPRVRSFKPGARGIGYPHDGSNGSGASFHLNVDATTN